MERQLKTYKLKINQKDFEVKIIKTTSALAEVEVNGEIYTVEFEKPAPSKTPIIISGTTVPSTESSVVTSKTSNPAEHKGTGNVKSPLPGVILDISVKQGDKVRVGDKLLTLEAMKMENNIQSDKEGVISSINVSVGDTVLEGDILIVIE